VVYDNNVYIWVVVWFGMSVKDNNGYCGAYRLLEDAYLERFEKIATSAKVKIIAYMDEMDRLDEYIVSNRDKVDLNDECSGLYVTLRAASNASFDLACRIGLVDKEKVDWREGRFAKFKMGIFY